MIENVRMRACAACVPEDLVELKAAIKRFIGATTGDPKTVRRSDEPRRVLAVVKRESAH
jgi:hypothetical protein